jgi:hypothetical protein
MKAFCLRPFVQSPKNITEAMIDFLHMRAFVDDDDGVGDRKEAAVNAREREREKREKTNSIKFLLANLIYLH